MEKAMTSFEPAMLPDEAKREMCEQLLNELGVTVTRVTPAGEMIHSCPLPYGQHSNGDAKPSASLNYKKLTFRCLGCGAKGGLLFFLGAVGGHEDPRGWLEGRTGLGGAAMDIDALLHVLDAIYAGNHIERAPMPHYEASVLFPWFWGDQYHGYLTEVRGIPYETCHLFSLGYAPEYFDGTERIIIPHWWNGSLVGWQARRIFSTDEPKYKNSPDFPRDRTFYNPPGDQETVVIVESPLSVLRHAHHAAMSASFGAALSDSQLRFLYGYPKIVLWMDNDKAGWESTQQVAEHLGRFSQVSVVDSPYSADPADMDDEMVDDLIQGAVPHTIWTPPRELIDL